MGHGGRRRRERTTSRGRGRSGRAEGPSRPCTTPTPRLSPASPRPSRPRRHRVRVRARKRRRASTRPAVAPDRGCRPTHLSSRTSSAAVIRHPRHAVRMIVPEVLGSESTGKPRFSAGSTCEECPDPTSLSVADNNARYHHTFVRGNAYSAAAQFSRSQETDVPGGFVAVASHAKATYAAHKGWFDDEIVPVERERHGLVTRDEGIRPDTTLERLAGLKPAFQHPSWDDAFPASAGSRRPATPARSLTAQQPCWSRPRTPWRGTDSRLVPVSLPWRWPATTSCSC